MTQGNVFKTPINHKNIQKEYLCMYNQITLMYSWNSHDTVKQYTSIKKFV